MIAGGLPAIDCWGVANSSYSAHRSCYYTFGSRLIFKWYHINDVTQLHNIVLLVSNYTNDIAASAVEDIIGKQEE